MAALNFNKQFAEAVAAGKKTQTIRRFRKDGRDPCRPGTRLQLYTGMRTKSCRKLADAICTSIAVVTLDRKRAVYNCNILKPRIRRDLAKRDGFESYDAMINWLLANNYEGREKVFTGHCIRWELVNAS